ncbi:MAG: cation-translocating P-type ATPase C-terminal domain-containing protein [Oscillospiraceae bacterium]|nr:cation-translocating P-type ATPase C-terminal domain-containing protein [Oscillospiraceae bacterium]
MAVLIGLLLWKQPPLLPAQLLLVSLATGVFPGLLLAIGSEPAGQDIMKQPPRPKNQGLFTRGSGLWQGLLIAAVTLTAYWGGADRMAGGHELGATMAMTVLALSQLLHAFTARSRYSLFRAGWLKNRYIFGALAGSLVLLTPAIVAPKLFGNVPMNGEQRIWIIALLLLPPMVCGMVKLIKNRIIKKRRS